MQSKLKLPYSRQAMFLLTVILFFYGIIAAKLFLYPLTFGFLIAYLLYPIVNWLEKHRIPRILAILISIIFAASTIALIAFFFYKQMTKLFADFSTLKDQANNNIELLQQNLEDFFGLKDNSVEQFLKMQGDSVFGPGNGSLGKIFSTTTGTAVRIFILPVYVFLFLYYRTKFAYFILKSVKRIHKKTVINILRDVATVAARYMGGVTIVVLILCVLNSTGLYIIGVKYALFLGIISAIFNFIPYFGTLMGGSVPFIFVLLTTEDPAYYGLRVILLFIIIQFTENNILTPNIVGHNVKINPFFIIVGLVLGATVWGIPGMIIIVPVLAISRMIFKNIEGMQHYEYLLGLRGTQRHAITITKIIRFFGFRKTKKS